MDRAALDVALELGLPCGGWCPKGRLAEDGPIDPRYPLNETKSSEYGERTEKNVEDSDGTLILTWGAPTGGTDFTIQMAENHKKPYLVVDLGEIKDPTEAGTWIKAHAIGVLNVAGPRESKNPGIYQKAKKFLLKRFVGKSQWLTPTVP